MADVVSGPANVAVLAGSTCGRCGLVAYPAEPYGCERCGAAAEEHRPTPLATTGTVRSSAVVHRHRAPDPPTPFVVVEVVLDAGPVVRALSADGPGAPPAIGSRVTGSRLGERFAFTVTDGA